MHCLLCGKKLALFRKSTHGDFCSAEHRVAYLTQQANLSLTRLLEMAPRAYEPEAASGLEGTPLDVTQFDADDSAMIQAMAAIPLSGRPASPSAAGFMSGLSLAPMASTAKIASISEPVFSRSRIAPSPVPAPIGGMRVMRAPAIMTNGHAAEAPAEPRMTHGLVFSALRLEPSLPETSLQLQCAELVLPWSEGQVADFSLESLVAAIWAKPGEMTPISGWLEMRITLAVAWPSLDAQVLLDSPLELPAEMPAEATDLSAAAEIAVERDPADDWDEIPEPLLETAFSESSGSASDRWEAYLKLQSTKRSRDLEVEPADMPGPVELPLQRYAAPANEPIATPIEWQTAKPRLVPAVELPRTQRDERFVTEPNLSLDSLAGIGRAQIRRPRVPWLPAMLPSAPAALGVVAIALLVVGAIAFLSIPESSKPSMATASSFSRRVDGLRGLIRTRAAVMMYDDFRSGLAAWDGPQDWAKDWTYDQAGFLRPGKFGILKDTMKMADYKIEFLGQIERKSLGWVVRANDDKNFQAAKLTISRPGPLPSVDLVHFRVMNGVVGPKISRPLPFTVRNDTLYNVQFSVKGDQFVARVNGVLVDFWSDNSLASGGVGFSSGAGEAARVRWLRVSDKDDFLGRVCSIIAARVVNLNEDGFLRAGQIPARPQPLRFAPFVVVVPNL